MGKRGVFGVALAAMALAARAHEPAAVQQPRQQQPQRAAAAPAKSDHFEQACVDLIHGRVPEGESAIKSLKRACSDLMAGKAEERLQQQQQRQAQIAAGQQPRAGGDQGSLGSGEIQEGEGVRASFERAASELVGSKRSQAMGFRRQGPVGTTLVSDPIGWFNGLGVNAELFRSFQPKFSWIAGARYSQTDASNGEASTFGAMGGIDWFIVGRNNEGLRVGPRLEVAAGREEFEGDTTFARLGLGGEVGYNFIATNGITGLLAGGLGGRVAGDEENEDFASFVGGEFGPYVKLGLGYSW